MEEISLRPARAADAAPLRRCIAAAYAVYADTVPDLPDVTGGLGEDIADGAAWVAERGGEIVGGLVLRLGDGAAHLANVAVRPDAAGVGLGRRLIALAEVRARDAGAEEIRLATHAEMPGNVALYRRLGWAVTGQEGNRVTMAKPL